MSPVRKSRDELPPLSKKRLSALQRQRDEDIDFSDIPELDKSFWDTAQVRLPSEKKAVYIRLDNDVLDWLKSQGKGYQTRINAILRAYYEAHQDDNRDSGS
ncbi:MAG: BrnA antitoxin family protein [Pseudomonadales bacterium]